MRAREFVHETFNQPYSFNWQGNDAQALIGRGEYLNIVFSRGIPGQYFLDFDVNGRKLVTGRGDAYRIFATVLAAIKEFVEKQDVKELQFNAKNDEEEGDSRTNLYDRLVKRYATSAGYNVTTKESGTYKTYKLLRKDLDLEGEDRWFREGVAEGSDFEKTIYMGEYAGFKILVSPHLLDQIQKRNITSNSIRAIIQQLPKVKDKIEKLQPSSALWLVDKRFTVSVGIRVLSDNKLKISTAVNSDSPYKFGTNTHTIYLNENFADGKQFRVTKQKNGFKVDLYVDGKHAGQYTHTRNEDDVRNFAEIFPEFRNKGHGGMLLLKAIDTADKLGMDFEEDSHSLTPAMSRLYDTLDSEGMIYGGGGAWAISPTGEDALDEYLNENFADGKVKGKSRPGRVKRSGASCKGSVTSLRAKAKKYSGERGKMYHWCANMKSGRNKK